jgi:branched-chain amino acid transport system substrate-binding protein
VDLRAWPLRIPVVTVTLALALAGCESMGAEKKKEGGGAQTEPGTGGGAATGAILVGHYGSMSGAQATFGNSTDNGIRLAIKERNAAGGVKGRKIELKTIDTAGKQSETATAVTRLINDHKVVAILGEVASSLSLVGGPIAQKARIPMISPSSTNPDVTDVGDYIFRVCFVDSFQGFVNAKFAREHLELDKAAIIYDQGQAYSSGLADDFEKAFKQLGGKITTKQAYTGGNLEVSSQLQTIKGSGAQVVFLPGYYSDVGTILRKARDAGIKAPFLGGDGWDSEELPKLAGDALNGNFFSNHYSSEEKSPMVEKFVEAYKRDNGGAVPDGLAALGYDAAMVLFDAMERAPSLAGADLRDAIAATKDFEGVTGRFSIDDNRNAKKSAVIIEYKGGKQTMAARVEP